MIIEQARVDIIVDSKIITCWLAYYRTVLANRVTRIYISCLLSISYLLLSYPFPGRWPKKYL